MLANRDEPSVSDEQVKELIELIRDVGRLELSLIEELQIPFLPLFAIIVKINEAAETSNRKHINHQNYPVYKEFCLIAARLVKQYQPYPFNWDNARWPLSDDQITYGAFQLAKHSLYTLDNFSPTENSEVVSAFAKLEDNQALFRGKSSLRLEQLYKIMSLKDKLDKEATKFFNTDRSGKLLKKSFLEQFMYQCSLEINNNDNQLCQQTPHQALVELGKTFDIQAVFAGKKSRVRDLIKEIVEDFDFAMQAAVNHSKNRLKK